MKNFLFISPNFPEQLLDVLPGTQEKRAECPRESEISLMRN